MPAPLHLARSHYAVAYGKDEDGFAVAMELIKAGAKLELADAKANTPLHYAAGCGDSARVAPRAAARGRIRGAASRASTAAEAAGVSFVFESQVWAPGVRAPSPRQRGERGRQARLTAALTSLTLRLTSCPAIAAL